MKRHTLKIASFLLALTTSTLGETAQWTLKPQFSSIVPFADDMLKVKLYSHSGVVDDAGNTIVATTYDSITTFTEGHALLLSAENGKYRLKGILHKDKTVTNINGDLFVGEYAFFSEDKMPVMNIRGIFGYINPRGETVVNFEYANVHPFCEGLAAVSKTNILKKVARTRSKMSYIDEHGIPITLQAEIGDVYAATSFSNGEAMVTNKAQQNYIINSSGSIIRIVSDLDLAFDKKYRLVDPNLAVDDDDDNRPVTTYANGPTPFQHDGLWGYASNGKVVLPPQFTSAHPFSNRYAIACRNGYWGMLHLQPGEFTCVRTKTETSTATPDEQVLTYDIKVPQCYDSERLYLYCNVGKQRRQNTTTFGKEKHSRSVTAVVPKEGYVLTVGTPDLDTWSEQRFPEIQDTPRPKVEKTTDISILFSTTKARANASKQASISVIIRNRGNNDEIVSVEIGGAVRKTAEIEVPAGGRKTVPVTFTNVTRFEERSISVHATGSGIDTSRSIKVELEPNLDNL